MSKNELVASNRKLALSAGDLAGLTAAVCAALGLDPAAHALAKHAADPAAAVALGARSHRRIVALHHRSSTFYQIHEYIRCLCF